METLAQINPKSAVTTQAPTQPSARPVPSKWINPEWLKSHGLPKIYRSANLDAVDPAVRQQIEAALNSLQKHAQRGEGFFLSGPCGVGKTHLLGLLMKEAWICGIGETFFVYAQDLFSSLVEKSEKNELNLWRWENSRLLLIDGFGEAYEHGFPFSRFELFIEKRVANQRATCFSTNLAVKEIVKNPDYARIVDRLKTCCFFFEIAGKSKRVALKWPEPSNA